MHSIDVSVPPLVGFSRCVHEAARGAYVAVRGIAEAYRGIPDVCLRRLAYEGTPKRMMSHTGRTDVGMISISQTV